jgi:hypothetical protein
MNKALVTLILSFLCVFMLVSQDNKIKETLGKMNISFVIPSGFFETPKAIQKDINYDIAFKNPDENIEYRLSLIPLETVNVFIRSNPKGDVRDALIMMTRTFIKAISQVSDIPVKITDFGFQEVKKEFGGDIGFSTVTTGNSQFTKGYKYVNITVIYRENKGAVFSYILYNDRDSFMTKMIKYSNAYYSFRFLK